MVDKAYGHLARDSEASIRTRLETRAAQAGDDVATAPGGEPAP